MNMLFGQQHVYQLILKLKPLILKIPIYLKSLLLQIKTKVNIREKSDSNLAKQMLKNKQGFLINFLIIYRLQNIKGFFLLFNIVILSMLILIIILIYLVIIIAQFTKTQSRTIFKEKFLLMTYLLNILKTIESGLLIVPLHKKNRRKMHLSNFEMVLA